MAHRIPIHQDDLSFEERQNKVWEDMEKDMERRRQEWEEEIERMRSDFFQLKPNSNGKLDALTDKISVKDTMDDTKTVIEKDHNGRPVFRARFNVHEYKPEEVNVKMDADKLIVYAKHEEKDGHKSVSREFSREVNIPKEVDPMALQCTISKDGILTAEAPMPVPGYQPITDAGYGTQRIIPTATTVVSNPPSRNVPTVMPTQAGVPTTHTSTFTTFMSPKGATSTSTPPPPSYSPGTGSTHQSSNANSVHRSFSPQSSVSSHVTSSSSKYETRSGSGSPHSMVDRDKRYRVEIDIEDFNPEDLNIKTVDKKLVITARKEERVGSRTSSKELNREFTLPDTVDPMQVKAFFSDSGKLLVEAPYLRSITVSHEGSPHFGTSSPLSGSLIR